ncbi:MAG: P-II family nitrogen regulator [Burkholderiales bacterium]|nr:P-II family nitrogen regulator [Burkholderiales bacterium]
MPAHAMKLVTIICESLAREAVAELLAEAGARGYTVFEVAGAGAHGERTAEIAEYGNVQFEVIVPPAVCEKLMARLEAEYLPRYLMVAYETDIRVRRGAKF